MNINNNNFQKNSNISRTLEILWRCNSVSRVEIARQLDLYRSTVSNIINSLIDVGLVFETEEGTSQPQGGRKPIYLSLNEKFGGILGIEIQPGNYKAVFINLHGEVLLKKSQDVQIDSLEICIKNIIDDFVTEIEKLNIPLLAVCVGLPGVIDSEKCKIINSDPFYLNDFSFFEFCEKNLNVPFLVENDANCLAWLQLARKRKTDLRDFLVVMAEEHSNGIGVGVALTFDNKVRYGRQFGSGEFISNSWRPGKSGQTGMSIEERKKILTDENAYFQWIKELFETLTPTISLLAPDCVFIHGEPTKRQKEIQSFLKKEVPQFFAVLEKSKCLFEFAVEDNYEVALGAASMMLQKLFTVPDITEIDSRTRFDWDYLFSIAKGNK